VESHEWDKLNTRVALRHPNIDKADQLSINLFAYIILENQST